jgi:hypothetical protein
MMSVKSVIVSSNDEPLCLEYVHVLCISSVRIKISSGRSFLSGYRMTLHNYGFVCKFRMRLVSWIDFMGFINKIFCGCGC